MDHRWGRNVFDYGLGSDGITLAARILSGPWTNFILGNQPGTLGYIRWFIFLDTEVTWIELGGGIDPAFPHFPYGYDVEPDGPV